VDVRLGAILRDPKTPARAGVTVLAAAIVMIGDVFAPFATQGCGLCRRGPGDTFPSISLGLASLGYLSNLQRGLSGVAMLLSAVGSLVLGVFEGVDAGVRIMGWGAPQAFEAGSNGPVLFVPEHVYYPPVYLDAGFYLFLAAAALAVIASVVVVLTMSSNPGRSRRTVTPALI
jgi:hypothetical protein